MTSFLDKTGLTYLWGKLKATFATKTTPMQAYGIPFAIVDSTSTATAFTATVPEISELKDGVCVLLKNGVVTSASGFTININNLGAKPAYSNMAAATAETTLFNINYTMLFVYDSTRVEGGGWILYRGYNSNDNTIGYQLRTNSSTRPASDKGYRYRLWFTSADGLKWVPANTSTSTNATTARTLNTRAIDPFGPIGYYSTNDTTNAEADLGKTTMWEQYALTIGYSYMQSGFALVTGAPVYLKATPQANGSAVMSSIVTALPSTEDGYIYIYLGQAYSTTAMELRPVHPVYYYKGGAIRQWTNGQPVPTIASTTSLLKGDNAGNAVAATAGTDYQAPLPSQSGNYGKFLTTDGYALSWGSSLPAVTAADDGKVLMVQNGQWVVGVLGGASYTVTISLTNPIKANYFDYFRITEQITSDGWQDTPPSGEGSSLGSISSPTGSTTITVDSSSYGFFCIMGGNGPEGASWPYPSTATHFTCTGGVTYAGWNSMAYQVFQVTGDGTVTIDGIRWEDD